MKIQFFGGNTFQVEGKDAKIVFDPIEKYSGSVDFATNSGKADFSGVKESKKRLMLPGEYEISGVLVMGYFSTNENVVYKVILDDISLVHFGELTEMPDTKFFDELGENIDVIFVSLHEGFDEKSAKELIETLEPRMAFLAGDSSFFPKMVESVGAKTAEENPMKISRSQLSDEKTEILILEA